ncbi:MarR family winged helix-turn-helix transcriptional regulator [Halalkalibacillus halophilus]|uniref:MarR family winged helix-turn-helix transcriptional regulator n=1 Tax=Halalkalibacillus halophilus TaxID=392827 RepID=UPI0004006AF9|nr:MarR family transcriptional regulator [Halalkalibacillus halophilus]
MNNKKIIKQINQDWTDIYHHLHVVHQENISHQAVRALQFIEKSESVTVGDLSNHLKVSHNTASEHVKRLIKKGYIAKIRSTEDERKVFVVLIEKGHEVLNKHTRLDEQKLEILLEDLSADEIEKIESTFTLLSRSAKHVSDN